MLGRCFAEVLPGAQLEEFHGAQHAIGHPCDVTAFQPTLCLDEVQLAAAISLLRHKKHAIPLDTPLKPARHGLDLVVGPRDLTYSVQLKLADFLEVQADELRHQHLAPVVEALLPIADTDR
eukprot:363578-Chlamydomonas_euryale.AAC.2